MTDYKYSKYNVQRRAPEGYVLYNLVTGMAVRAPECCIEPSQLKESDPARYEEMIEKGIVVENSFDEARYLVEKHDELKDTHKMLVLTIMPTRNCNFKCVYCFEEHRDISMDRNLIPYLMNFIEGRVAEGNIEDIVVIYWGGEPLLEIELVDEISDCIVKYSDSRGIAYDARLITNGYYLDRYIPHIVKNRISEIQVTFDGLKGVHDSRKKTADGLGTYEVLWKNLMMLADHDIDVNVRMNLDERNIASIGPFIDTLQANGQGRRARYSAYPALVSPYSGSGTCRSGMCCEGGDARGELLKSMQCVKDKCGIVNRQKFIWAHCNYAFPNCVTIDPEGYVFKCWAEVEDRQKAVGNIKDAPVLNKAVSQCGESFRRKCLRCKIFPVCMGGCMALRDGADYCKERAVQTMQSIDAVCASAVL